MRVLVSGASGLIGSAVCAAFHSAGHEVARLTRGARPSEGESVVWDVAAGTIERARLEAFEAIVHLAGETLAGRWTPEKKRAIRDSRVRGTQLLAGALAELRKRPRVLVSASAVGYYGDRGDEILTEESGSGSGFLAEVCRAWEAATQPAADAGVRVVMLRFGVVLSSQGGALARMLPPFRLGLGARLGTGRQWMSWIALDDAVSAIQWALDHESLSGPVNAVAPNPVTNAELTRTLAKVLRRPAPFGAPAAALRLALGEMAEATLLASQRALPTRLLAGGFCFGHPELEGA